MYSEINEILSYTLYDNTIAKWGTAIILGLFSYITFHLFKRVVITWIRKLANRTEISLDDLVADLLDQTKSFAILAIVIRISTLALELPSTIDSFFTYAIVISIFVQLGLWGNTIIDFWIKKAVEEKQKTEDIAGLSAYGAISFFARFGLWSVISLLMLDNLGLDITALVAGLGVGSVAIALAVQNILGDIFCSISIILDKPFEVGDFIVVGENAGVVDKIGIKSTRIKSLQGEQIVVANADLLGSRIQNFKRMNERRVVFALGVTYQTESEKLKEIPSIVRAAVESNDTVRFDRAHFKNFGDFSLNFEIVYYVLSRDYNIYMDIQEKINLEVFEQFNNRNIEFAYPTQTLFLEKE